MSDCTQGGRRAYNAPTHTPAEDRLEITIHFHGEFNPHPIVLNRLDREVDYVTVDDEDDQPWAFFTMWVREMVVDEC